ncbi:MAG: hypothetical protein LC687_04725 [Actinobacteria bacterium]|nr:hypothetical protein [Actinomycetota bacterium]MCA1807138.1 hypothetical protein [Actinomycetota bacterium]
MSKNVAVVTFGRFNPPTLGHKVVLDTMIQAGKLAAQDANTKAVSLFVVPSPSQDKKKNPLSVDYRKKVLDQVTESNIHVGIDGREPRTIIEVAVALKEKGYTDLIVVVGTDRVADFQDLLDRYNGEPTKAGEVLYEFEEITVVQAGEARSGAAEIDPDAETSLSDISASAARKAVTDNDFATFKSIFIDPSNEKLAREVFKEVQSGLGIVAEVEEENEVPAPDQDDLEEGARSIIESINSHIFRAPEDQEYKIREGIVGRENGTLEETFPDISVLSYGNASIKLIHDHQHGEATITDASVHLSGEFKSSIKESSERAGELYEDLAHVMSMGVDASLKNGFLETRLDVHRGEYGSILDKDYLSRGVLFREAIRRMPRKYSSRIDVYLI